MISERVQELLVRARNAFRLRDYETADVLVDQMLEEYPESIAGHILKGIILGRTRRNKDAIRVFRRALELDPVNPEAFNNIAVSLRQEGQVRQALRAVQQAEELFGERADILYNKGNILKDLGQIEEAIAAYLQALEVDDRYVLAYNNLGTLYQGRGQVKRAIETFSLGLAIDPNHPTLRYNLGLAYEEEGRLKDAESEYARSLKSRPGWGEALNNLGIVYQKQERFDEADRAFREILKINKKDPRANNNIATNFALQGRTREAMQFYREALESDPSYSRAAGNLGQLIDTDKDVSGALDELQQLAALDTDNLELQFRLGSALLRAGKYPEAEAILLRILEADPKHVEAIRILADVYMRSGQDGKAEEAYKRLVTLNADYTDHHYDRARVFQIRKEIDAALREVEEYLEAKPGDLDGLLLKASIQVDSGRQAEAIGMLEELRNIYPGDGRLLAAIATAHQRGGERDEALRAFDELINLQGSRATEEDIQALTESLEMYEQAMESFASENPNDWDRNINRLVELSQPEEEEQEEADVAMDEQVSLDEDSIPILSFGGEELLEPEEWEVQIQEDEIEPEDEYLGIEPAQSVAPSLTSLPEQTQLRGGEQFAEGLRPTYDGGGIAPPPPPQAPITAEEPPPQPEPAPQPQPQPQPQPAPQPQQQAPPSQPAEPPPAQPPAPQQPYPDTPPPAYPEPPPYPDLPAYPEPPVYPEPMPYVPAEEIPEEEPEDDELLEDELEEEDELADVPEDFELIEDDSVVPDDADLEPDLDELGLVDDDEEGDEDEETGIDEESEEQLDDEIIDELVDANGLPLGGDDELELPETSDDAIEVDLNDEALDDDTEGFAFDLDESGEDAEDLAGYEDDVPTIDELIDGDEEGEDGEEAPSDVDPDAEPDDSADEAEPLVQPAPMAPPRPPMVPRPPRRPPPPPSGKKTAAVGLLDYLSNMADALPDQKKQEFMDSEVRLKLEYVRAQLAGRPGLREDGAKFAKPAPEQKPVSITPTRVRDTLSYIGQMSSYHPDTGIGTALKRRVGVVLEHMQSLGKDPGEGTDQG